MKVNEKAASDYSGAVIALLTALPFGSAALIMLFTAKHSASTGILHIVLRFRLKGNAQTLLVLHRHVAIRC